MLQPCYLMHSHYHCFMINCWYVLKFLCVTGRHGVPCRYRLDILVRYNVIDILVAITCIRKVYSDLCFGLYSPSDKTSSNGISRNLGAANLSYRIALKFDRLLDSTAVETPVKLQSNRSALGASKFRDRLTIKRVILLSEIQRLCVLTDLVKFLQRNSVWWMVFEIACFCLSYISPYSYGTFL